MTLEDSRCPYCGRGAPTAGELRAGSIDYTSERDDGDANVCFYCERVSVVEGGRLQPIDLRDLTVVDRAKVDQAVSIIQGAKRRLAPPN